MVKRFGKVALTDASTEVVVDRQGRIVVDTIRSWAGVDAQGKRTTVYAPTREFLYLDPKTGKELGDRSRFFRDGYASPAMKKDVQFNVYLPPSYSKDSTRRFPVVYLLHGINGSNIEWEVRNIDRLLDGLFTKGGLEESIVVFPDGSSGWYVDSSAGNYRTMIVNEILPMVDKQYRTKADREHRAMSGVSMGGFGTYSIGLEHPELFSSLASHMGALSLPALAGTREEMAANAKYQPMAMAAARTPDQLKQYRFYMDGGDSDIFRFGEAARVMSAQLTAKTVPHVAQYGPGGHDDEYFVPKLKDSFKLHSEQFRSAKK
jgi:enterochelin esterase-like enzyme